MKKKKIAKNTQVFKELIYYKVRIYDQAVSYL